MLRARDHYCAAALVSENRRALLDTFKDLGPMRFKDVELEFPLFQTRHLKAYVDELYNGGLLKRTFGQYSLTLAPARSLKDSLCDTFGPHGAALDQDAVSRELLALAHPERVLVLLSAQQKRPWELVRADWRETSEHYRQKVTLKTRRVINARKLCAASGVLAADETWQPGTFGATLSYLEGLLA